MTPNSQAPSVGWDELYEYALLIVVVLHLVLFGLWEKYWAKNPILLFDIWTAPSFPALIPVSLLSLMAFGVLIFYVMAWLLTIRNWSLLLASAAITLLTVFGAVAALLSAWLISRLDAQYTLAFGATCIVVSTTLVATMPAQQTYWVQLFPAAVPMAFCPDFISAAAQIIASNSVEWEQQGIAASLIGTIVTYDQSIGFGFAGTIEKYTVSGDTDPVQGYRNALYFGIGLGGAALVLNLLFVREGWEKDDEISQWEAESA
ncbi:hypothetical protein QQZ08_008598 [Neonectria magnoliae]|uniref:Uncharacterized protein n=1 Tax=Neonectria magnoliae TaxID=2732573 RepID=A0ABR1HTN5_9HYPO